MKKIGVLLYVVLFYACSGNDYYAPDYFDPDLLPDTDDYLTDDYGTQALAKEIAASYSGFQNDSMLIQLVLYDNETRKQPLLTFTQSKWTVQLTPIEKNGLLTLQFKDYQTAMMPLKMTATIDLKLKLNARKDTIWLYGSDGIVRTETTGDQPIGTPNPESDEAELEGYFVRNTEKIYLLFDLMLPIAMKAHINGIK